jgi:hypothetical protein
MPFRFWVVMCGLASRGTTQPQATCLLASMRQRFSFGNGVYFVTIWGRFQNRKRTNTLRNEIARHGDTGCSATATCCSSLSAL